jgi:hypothetical protein
MLGTGPHTQREKRRALANSHPKRQALAPQLEAMEAAWARLHMLTGADTPQDIIAFWEGACSIQ